jgi:hypothetical protein
VPLFIGVSILCWCSTQRVVRYWIVLIKGDIPISAFDPHIFQFGSLYSNLIPSSNFSIPIRVILGVGYSN